MAEGFGKAVTRGALISACALLGVAGMAAPPAVAVAAAGVPAAAAAAAPPAGNISSNVDFVANIPDLPSAISIAFIGETMFVSTVHGIYSFDVSDPTNPQLLGASLQYIWENEHMTADPARKRIFVSRDPRGYTTPATSGGTFPEGAVEVFDVSNPRAMVLSGYIRLPAGHTSTCIDGCDYLWTGGPASGSFNPADWAGRPIFATDVRDPLNPVSCPGPLDLHSNDGVTDYAHSVDVDANGVAWVSGRGHVRGYWTSGRHLDPTTGAARDATGCDPIPYAGGGTVEGNAADAIIHNSWHNLSLSVDGRAGDLIAATEERVTTDCTLAGRFLTYDLGGSYQGQGWNGTDRTHFRLRRLGQWTPENQPGSTGCDSAHWFTDRGDGVIAIAFYTQGTRFLDIRDPYHIRQVGWFNIPGEQTTGQNLQGGNTWAAYWHDGLVFTADFNRGVDILRYHDPAAGPAPVVAAARVAAQPAVQAPLPVTAPPSRSPLALMLALFLLTATAVGIRSRRRQPLGEGGGPRPDP